jgi:exo-beta-1,3-glucanase (GH17 family)
MNRFSRTYPEHSPIRSPLGRLSLVAALTAVLLLAWLPAGMTGAPAAAATVNRWYLAEGYTGSGIQEYVCVGNAGSAAAEVTFTFLFNDRRSIELTRSIAARSRYTVDVNQVVGKDREVSVIVSSASSALAVERSEYFLYNGVYPGSHIAQAVTATSRTWYFAEGYTGPGFDEYICVLNPGSTPASLTFQFQGTCGDETRGGLSVPANSRRTFKVNDLVGCDKEVSVKLLSDVPVVAERPMYFYYRGSTNLHWEGGHCVMGASTLATEFMFAEGTTRAGFEEWLTIQNPNASAMTVKAVYQFGPGQGGPMSRNYRVEGKRRLTVFVPDEVGRGKEVSVRLTSPTPFLAERPLYYYNIHSGLVFEGGHCAAGIPAARQQWFLAEGYTGKYFEEWLCIQNSSAEDAVLDVEYYTQQAGPLPVRTVKVPGNTRVTLFVNEHAGPDLELAVRLTVKSGPNVVVERPIYFERELGMPSGRHSDVLYGLCFSPYLTEDPINGGWVSVERVAQLMDKIAPYTRWIRTFCSQGEWDAMPGLAIERGLNVAAGCDIYSDLGRNQREVDSLIAQVNRGEVDLAVVGDEVMYMNALTEDQLIGYIRQVKASGAVTTTSETDVEIKAHPRIAQECDVVIANIYPYWEGVTIDQAVAHLESDYRDVQKVAPGKKVIVETGWPSAGPVVDGAVPSPANAARYLDEFMEWAYDRGVEYFYFEAFDELWKDAREGSCGSHWGLWTVDETLKPEVAGVIRSWR